MIVSPELILPDFVVVTELESQLNEKLNPSVTVKSKVIDFSTPLSDRALMVIVYGAPDVFCVSPAPPVKVVRMVA